MSEDLAQLPSEPVDIDKLKPHPKNYREHPEDQLAHIKKSIEQNGVYRPIVTAKDYTILAGHGVTKAAKEMGLKQLPVCLLDLDPDEPRALKILAGDNEMSKLAYGDDRALSELLKEVKAVDPDGLLGTGYDDQQLAMLVMVTRPSSEVEDMDAAREWVGMPDYDAGEPESKKYELLIKFDTLEERDEFIVERGLGHKSVSTQPATPTGGMVIESTRRAIMSWPPQEMNDTVNLEWQDGEAEA